MGEPPLRRRFLSQVNLRCRRRCGEKPKVAFAFGLHIGSAGGRIFGGADLHGRFSFSKDYARVVKEAFGNEVLPISGYVSNPRECQGDDLPLEL